MNLLTAKKLLVLVCSLLIAAFIAVPFVSLGQNPVAVVPGEMLVQFRASATAAEKSRAFARISATQKSVLVSKNKRADGGGDLVQVAYQANLSSPQARRALAADGAVEFAEPNWLHQPDAVSNDPYYTSGTQWGMYGPLTSPANVYGSAAGTAWALGVTGSNTVYVGMIDDGIQYNHPDLDGQVWVNPYDPIDGVDNDGNGYTDDVRGWDFANNDSSIYDGGRRGTVDVHGTHVAGILGAKGGNGAGVAGVSWNIKLISTKFIGPLGGDTANAVRALDYLIDLKQRHGLNLVAANASWGGGDYSQALSDAIARAAAANILFVASAGNGGADKVADNNDAAPHYPSSYPHANIISVTGIDAAGAKYVSGNYGATSVDIAAPAVNLLAPVPFGKYGSYSGTSGATPFVTGAVALYASTHPGASYQQIKNAILTGAVPTASMTGKCVTGGRLHIPTALLF